jgi:hypothetical protein
MSRFWNSPRRPEAFCREIQFLPVMRLEHQEPDRSGIHSILPQIPCRGDIPEPLRHFFAADVQELAMYPVSRELLLPCVRAALSDFVLMVRKDQIDPTGMNIQHV